MFIEAQVAFRGGGMDMAEGLSKRDVVFLYFVRTPQNKPTPARIRRILYNWPRAAVTHVLYLRVFLFPSVWSNEKYCSRFQLLLAM